MSGPQPNRSGSTSGLRAARRTLSTCGTTFLNRCIKRQVAPSAIWRVEYRDCVYREAMLGRPYITSFESSRTLNGKRELVSCESGAVILSRE